MVTKECGAKAAPQYRKVVMLCFRPRQDERRARGVGCWHQHCNAEKVRPRPVLSCHSANWKVG